MKSHFLSKRLERVQQSATLKMATATRALIQKGYSVANFSIGEPHFLVDDTIKAAAIQAIQNNQNRYTPVPGTLELRKKIAAKLQRENRLTYTEAMISVATGAKQSLFNALMALLNEGDEVLIPSPYWTSYPEMVELAGGAPRYLVTSEKEHFKLSPSTLRLALNNKTKILILNSPCNPTGAVYSEAELRALWEVLQDSSVFILSDEIYEHLVFPPHQVTSFASLSPEAFQRTLTINGFSKAFAMTGWRLGYAAGPLVVIEAMNLIQGQSTSGPNAIAQAAGEAALELDSSFFESQQKELSHLKQVMMQGLQSASELFWEDPAGTFYLFVNIAAYKKSQTPSGKAINTSEELALYLLEEAHVATVAGSGFGQDDYLRLSFATSQDQIKQGTQRLVKALHQLRSK